MAGHSHSANIAVRKGKQDAARGKLFSKLSRYIIIAAKAGGGDPDTNLRLRYAIDKARAVSMPRDNIERAVKKGTGELDGETLDEINYEGYGPGGVAILVEVLTDNRNRTSAEIRKIFERGGGKMGSAGAVGYLFERKGVFGVDKHAIDEDSLMSIALDAGADDLKALASSYEITCDPTAFTQVQEALKANGLTPTVAELSQVAKVLVDVSVEDGKKVLRLMEALDDHDDVQNVYANANLTDELLAAMEV